MQKTQLSENAIRMVRQHINQSALPKEFIHTVQEYYLPVIESVVDEVQIPAFSKQNRPYFLAIQGTQGSGKSTFASFIKLILETQFQLKCTVLSIDDFYLTKQERLELSDKIHPLLATRGVPGTHDIQLLNDTLNKLAEYDGKEALEIVTFDKAKDDRADTAEWQKITESQDVVILEGWCVGVSAQPEDQLNLPINELEKIEDIDSTWRRYVNQQIKQLYQPIYDRFDGLAVLLAPSFECVFEWRLKQEQKLIDKLGTAVNDSDGIMSPEQIKRFISHYQRITEHGLLTLPTKANWILRLQADHAINELQVP